MKFTPGAAVLVCSLFLWTVSVSAHHALQAQFDTNKVLRLTGQLARIEWINPHAYFWFDVKDETGKVTQWGAETVGPTALRQAGFLRGTGVVPRRRYVYVRGLRGPRRRFANFHLRDPLRGRPQGPDLVRRRVGE